MLDTTILRRGLAGFTLALTLVGVGCSPAAQAPAQPTSAGAVKPTAAPAATTAPAAATSAPAVAASSAVKKDGTMVIGLPQEPGSLDPQATTSLISQRIREQLFDSLVAADFDNKTLRPSLADSWQVSPDGLTYTFKLRTDVTFHSGKKMTSEDVKYTLERWKQSKSPNNWLIAGLQEVQAPDPATTVLKMANPNPELLYNLARSDASILNRESVESAGKDFGSKVVDGTGPFKLKEWVVKNRVVLERFDAYKWAPPNYQNRGPAYLKQIIWKSIPEQATQLLELETGTIHALPPRIPFNEVDRLKGLKEVRIMDFPMGSTVIIGFNPAMPPMDDLAVRQAVIQGIDRKQLVDKVLYGHATLGVSLVAPGIEGFCEPCKALIPPYDPAKAKQTLDEAGWKPGPDGVRVKDGKRLAFPATVYNLEPYPEAYTVIQAQLRDIGVALDVQVTETAKVFEMYQQKTHGLWSTSLPHDTPFQATYNFLYSSANRFSWKNAEVDALLEKASTSTDKAARESAYVDAQKIALQNALFVPFFHEQGLVAVSSKVHGFKPYGYVNSVFHKMTDTWVE